MNSRSSTAVLFFSRRSFCESNYKQLDIRQNKERNQKIHHLVISHCYRMVNRSGLDVFWWDDSRQKGENFKDRFRNAFQEIFSLGYQNIISVGGDCPGLSSVDIHSASSQIRQDQVVLGPASDGGIYLLGISSTAFEAIDFNQIAWETQQVYQNIHEQISAAGLRFSILQVKLDLDSQADLGMLLKSRKLQPGLFNRLLNLLYVKFIAIECQLIYKYNTSLFISSRAPPYLIQFPH